MEARIRLNYQALLKKNVIFFRMGVNIKSLFLFMKKFLTALVLGVLFPVSVLAAYAPGIYTAKLNLNIRSLPSMSGLLIGHFNQGDTVNVLQVLGSWCRVASKYTNSYVYCSILAPATGASMIAPATVSTSSTVVPVATSSSVVTNGLVTQNLKGLQNWLLTNNEGVNYINNSYFTSRDASLQWDAESRISDFYFQWPLLTTESKCSMVFSGSYHTAEIFKSQCFDAAGKISTSQVEVTTPEAGYNLPVLPFKGFVANMLTDKTLMASLDNYFAKSQNVTGLFRLYKDVHGVEIWEAKFIDETSGYFMIVSTDSSKTDSSLQVQTGMFQ